MCGCSKCNPNSYIAHLQTLEVAYLTYRRCYFYPVLVLILFTVSFMALSKELSRTRKKIVALVNLVRLTPLVVGGCVRGVSSHRLLPGDVLVLQPGKALFDMVLLQGNCLCIESMLSGEVWPLLCLQLSVVTLALFQFFSIRTQACSHSAVTKTYTNGMPKQSVGNFSTRGPWRLYTHPL